MGKRCTGACCEAFYLPYSPREVWNFYHIWKVSQGDTKHQTLLEMNSGLTTTPRMITEIYIIAPMLTYLGFIPRPFDVVDGRSAEDETAHYYTCKHFDTEARKCTIYEHRPLMCRDYPYKSGCRYKACRWSGHQVKKSSGVKVIKGRDAKVELASSFETLNLEDVGADKMKGEK